MAIIEPAKPKTGHPTPQARAPRKPATVAPVRSARSAARREALDGIGKMASLLCAMRGQYADAGAVAQHGPGIAREVAALGDTNDTWASWLDYLTQTGPYMGLFAAGLPFALQLAANHGKLDVSKLPPESGVIEPAILEEKVRAEMALASQRMLAEIRAIQAQVADAQNAESL